MRCAYNLNIIKVIVTSSMLTCTVAYKLILNTHYIHSIVHIIDVNSVIRTLFIVKEKYKLFNVIYLLTLNIMINNGRIVNIGYQSIADTESPNTFSILLKVSPILSCASIACSIGDSFLGQNFDIYPILFYLKIIF